MKHYFNAMSRAVTTHWMLCELDASYEQIMVDFANGDTNKPDFRAINPMGKIPILVDDEIVVTEATAICTYLADKYIERGFAPELNSKARGNYYRCLFFSGSTLEPMLSLNQLDLGDYSAQPMGFGDIDRCLASIEAMTPEADWILGEQISAADLVFGGTLDFSMQFGWFENPSAKVIDYVGRLRARDAYRETHPESWYA